MRTVAVVSAARSDYGLLYWILREILASEDLDLHLIITGTHLSERHGYTLNEIERDEIPISSRISLCPESDDPASITAAMGQALVQFGHELAKVDPDVLVVLGDRFEMLVAAQAAMIGKIPIAHIHGGEATEGLIDEAIRHSLTKMAQIHFVAAEPYRKRVIQLGEVPEHVYNVGAPGLDFISRLVPMSRDELEQDLSFSFDPVCFIVTYHPVTLDSDQTDSECRALCEALADFPDARIIVTGVNSDTDNDLVRNQLRQFALDNADRVLLRESLGQRRYLSAVREADAVIGNSSSGIIEAPFLKTPTVNIGRRQQGRLKAASIIDCDGTYESVRNAIAAVLTPEFKATTDRAPSVYGVGDTSKEIVKKLAAVRLEGILQKPFYDLPH